MRICWRIWRPIINYLQFKSVVVHWISQSSQALLQLGMLKVLVPKKAADGIFGQNSWMPQTHQFHPNSVDFDVCKRTKMIQTVSSDFERKSSSFSVATTRWFGSCSMPWRPWPLVDASDCVYVIVYRCIQNYWEVWFFRTNRMGFQRGRPCRDMVP